MHINADTKVKRAMSPTDIQPEQIDTFLTAEAYAPVVPRTGIGDVYCYFGRLMGIRPEILVAQACQEISFFQDNIFGFGWVHCNNPGEMKFFDNYFSKEAAPPGRFCAPHPMRHRKAWKNQEYRNVPWKFATFITKRHGIRTHFERSLDFLDDNTTVHQFLHRYGTGKTATIVDIANRIQNTPRLRAPGIREGYMGRAIGRLADRGIIRGYIGGVFRPEWPLTRAEMAVMLERAFGQDKRFEQTTRPLPADVLSHWAKNNIRWVLNTGLMIGDGKRWRPEGFLTRAETCMIMQRVAGITALRPVHTLNRMKVFSDVKSTDWFVNAVHWAYTNGWLDEFAERNLDNKNMFLPRFAVTRAEMAFLLSAVLSQRSKLMSKQLSKQQEFVPAIWSEHSQKWIPKWAIGGFVDREETFSTPFIPVPEAIVASKSELAAIKPWRSIAIASGLVAISAGVLWSLRK